MSLSPRLIYLAALTLLATAGVLLSARGGLDPADIATDGCGATPRVAVAEVAGAPIASEESRTQDGTRFDRWLDADGRVLAEVRCAPTTLLEIQEHEAAVARAREADGPVAVLDTDPAATIETTSVGTFVQQVDRDAGLSRTWFVDGELTAEEATALVRATLAGADTSAVASGPTRIR